VGGLRKSNRPLVEENNWPRGTFEEKKTFAPWTSVWGRAGSKTALPLGHTGGTGGPTTGSLFSTRCRGDQRRNYRGEPDGGLACARRCPWIAPGEHSLADTGFAPLRQAREKMVGGKAASLTPCAGTAGFIASMRVWMSEKNRQPASGCGGVRATRPPLAPEVIERVSAGLPARPLDANWLTTNLGGAGQHRGGKTHCRFGRPWARYATMTGRARPVSRIFARSPYRRGRAYEIRAKRA